MTIAKYHACLAVKPSEEQKLRATEAKLLSKSKYRISISEAAGGRWELQVESETKLDAELLSAASFLSGKRSWILGNEHETLAKQQWKNG